MFHHRHLLRLNHLTFVCLILTHNFILPSVPMLSRSESTRIREVAREKQLNLFRQEREQGFQILMFPKCEIELLKILEQNINAPKPNTSSLLIWNGVIVVGILYQLVLVPFHLAFLDYEPLTKLSFLNWFHWMIYGLFFIDSASSIGHWVRKKVRSENEIHQISNDSFEKKQCWKCYTQSKKEICGRSMTNWISMETVTFLSQNYSNASENSVYNRLFDSSLVQDKKFQNRPFVKSSRRRILTTMAPSNSTNFTGYHYTTPFSPLPAGWTDTSFICRSGERKSRRKWFRPNVPRRGCYWLHSVAHYSLFDCPLRALFGRRCRLEISANVPLGGKNR